MMHNCYFCKNEVRPDKDGIAQCYKCYDVYHIYESYTVFANTTEDIEYAHLYLEKSADELYHVRITPSENCTEIFLESGDFYKEIAELSGTPINGENIREKLKTILTFL